jgi:hypothetical protein
MALTSARMNQLRLMNEKMSFLPACVQLKFRRAAPHRHGYQRHQGSNNEIPLLSVEPDNNNTLIAITIMITIRIVGATTTTTVNGVARSDIHPAPTLRAPQASRPNDVLIRHDGQASRFHLHLRLFQLLLSIGLICGHGITSPLWRRVRTRARHTSHSFHRSSFSGSASEIRSLEALSRTRRVLLLLHLARKQRKKIHQAQ